MKALVIGAAGFVGGYLVDYLRRDRRWSICATKLFHEAMDKPEIAVFDLDILNRDAVQALLAQERPEWIFHLAAQSSVALSWEKPELTVDINVGGSINLLEAVRGLDYKPRVLLVGSGEEYGYIRPEECPVTEETVLRPGNIYAATKACQGMLGAVYAKAYGLEVMMVRAFNHIGPGQSPMFAVGNFCRQIAQIEAGRCSPVMQVGNLEAKRDFTDVRDVVRAYGLLMKQGRSGIIYNVGSGHAVSVGQLLDRLLALARVEITVQQDPSRMRPSDVPIIEADVARLRQDTGWQPEIPLEQTLEATLEYWRKTIYLGALPECKP